MRNRKEGATHKGWIFYLVPVYLTFYGPDEPVVEVRYGWLEWWFDVCEALFGCATYIATMINPDIEPTFPILITGEIHH